MAWEQIKTDEENNRRQLWSKIKRLEREAREKSEIIIDLQRKLEGRSDYEDILDELDELKKENANLKRSNTMLKNKRTS